MGSRELRRCQSTGGNVFVQFVDCVFVRRTMGHIPYLLRGAKWIDCAFENTSINDAILHTRGTFKECCFYEYERWTRKMSGASFVRCLLPAPPRVLTGDWGCLSDKLTLELMRYDASCHPKPRLFDEWAKGGACPYIGVRVCRAACFREKRELWEPGPSKPPYVLMKMLLKEKCPGSVL